MPNHCHLITHHELQQRLALRLAGQWLCMGLLLSARLGTTTSTHVSVMLVMSTPCVAWLLAPPLARVHQWLEQAAWHHALQPASRELFMLKVRLPFTRALLIALELALVTALLRLLMGIADGSGITTST